MESKNYSDNTPSKLQLLRITATNIIHKILIIRQLIKVPCIN